MATNLNNLDEVKLEYIETLSDNGLEQLIDGLSKRYYQAFIDGDVDRMNSTLSFIEDIDLIVEDKQYDFNCFVNYCMLCNANFIIKTIYKKDIELNPFYNPGMKKNDAIKMFGKAFERNKYAFIGGADRIHIKNLHQMCKEDPTINAEIMAIVDALHESFIDKEKHKNEIGGAND